MDTEVLESHREILSQICPSYDLVELSKEEITETDGEAVHKRVVTKGFFTHEDRHYAVWTRELPEEYWPTPIRGWLAKSQEVRHVYEGEKYFLVQLNEKVKAFNIEYYNLIRSLMTELDYYIRTPLLKTLLDDQGRLYLESSWVYFGIAGLNMAAPAEEEERVILSDRLAASLPFFEFKAPIQVDWQELKEDKSEHFEKICELLLGKDSRIERVIPIGKTKASDRGRDFIVHERDSSILKKEVTKWLVQCKFSDSSISPSTIAGWTDRVIEHHLDGYWLMTNNDLTPTLIDQFKGVEENPKLDIKVRFWQRTDFHIKLNVYSEILKNLDLFEQTSGMETRA